MQNEPFINFNIGETGNGLMFAHIARYQQFLTHDAPLTLNQAIVLHSQFEGDRPIRQKQEVSQSGSMHPNENIGVSSDSQLLSKA